MRRDNPTLLSHIQERTYNGKSSEISLFGGLKERLLGCLTSLVALDATGSCDNNSSKEARAIPSHAFLGPWPIPFCLKFAKGRNTGHLLAVCNEDGQCAIFDTCKSTTKVHSRWAAHANCIFDVNWFDNDSKIITASGDQTIALWDVESQKPVGVLAGHTASIKTVSVNPSNEALIISGGRDGAMCLWDSRTASLSIFPSTCNKFSPVLSVHGAHAPEKIPGTRKRTRIYGNPLHSVTCVQFAPDGNQILTAGVDGKLKVWDIRQFSESKTNSKKANHGTMKWEPLSVLDNSENNKRPYAISSFSLLSDGTRVVACSTDGRLCLYDWTAPGFNLKSTYIGPTSTTLFTKVSISNDDRYVVSGSGEEAAYLWRLSSPGKPMLTLEGHQNEVTCLDWSKTEFAKLATCSDDLTMRVWSLENSGIPQASRLSQKCHRCIDSPDHRDAGDNTVHHAGIVHYGHSHSCLDGTHKFQTQSTLQLSFLHPSLNTMPRNLLQTNLPLLPLNNLQT